MGQDIRGSCGNQPCNLPTQTVKMVAFNSTKSHLSLFLQILPTNVYIFGQQPTANSADPDEMPQNLARVFFYIKIFFFKFWFPWQHEFCFDSILLTIFGQYLTRIIPVIFGQIWPSGSKLILI